MLKRIVRKGVRVAKAWLSSDDDTRVSDDEAFAYASINALHRQITREAPLIDRPGYLWGALHGACLAKRLEFGSASLIEFGVAGGNGLIALELIADRIERHLGMKISVYGFDTGKGLPAPKDLRDCPNLYTEGTFPMDVEKLRSRLRRAELILGMVDETVPLFVSTYKPAPVAFVSVDLDLYTSTKQALHLFEADTSMLLPRVHCYFDDINGFTFAEFNGERLAIAEFNQAGTQRKISPMYVLRYYVPTRCADDPWVHRFYMAHILDHELYGRNDGLSRLSRLDLVDPPGTQPLTCSFLGFLKKCVRRACCRRSGPYIPGTPLAGNFQIQGIA
jgi:hypothetical protein